MRTATARRLRIVALDHKARAALDEYAGGGFWRRNPIHAIKRIRGGWQYGYEIGGYGTVFGYCKWYAHEHKTEQEALDCGARYEAGIPHWAFWVKPATKETTDA